MNGDRTTGAIPDVSSPRIPGGAEGEKRLFIGLPIYGSVDPHFFLCAMKLMARFSGHYSIKPIMGDSLISRARNNLTHAFLKSDCTHLLFIDSDIVFSDDHITRLLSHDKDIVGGFYCKKQDSPQAELVCNMFSVPREVDSNGLLPLDYIGTGFICVARRVFEKMIEAFGDDIAYIDDGDKEKKYDFWRVGVYKYKDGTRPRYLSEDWFFCQLAKDLGFSVFGDSFIMLKHSGGSVYPLKHQEESLFRTSQSGSDTAASVEPSPAAVAAEFFVSNPSPAVVADTEAAAVASDK